ncbi:ABC transporter substrate-binding protein [Actinomadura logoneensis]|nr:ABC transporter substrate-binding protein [Actinomadura logoneensis]
MLERPLRILRPAAAVATLLLAVAACGGGSSDDASGGGGSATFTYWTTSWTPEQISRIDADFAKAHPGLHSKGQFIASADQYLPKVVSAIKSNTQPTVLLTQNASDLPEIAQSGKLIPLDGDLKQETAGLYPGIKDALFYKGKQLGFARSGVGDIVLFYNKKDFKEAGIANPPATWAELVEDAKKLTDPGKKRFGYYVPLGEAEWITFAWTPLLRANGGDLLTPDGTRSAFNTPQGVKALQTWVDLMTAKAAPTTSFAQAGSFDGAPAFASHTVSMMANGQWAVDTFKKAGLDFGVAPLPRGDAGPSTSVGMEVAALLKTSRAQERAGLEFIRYLARPQVGAHLAAANGGLPSAPDQLQQPELKEHIAKDPYYQTFADGLKFGKGRPMTPAYNAVSEALYTEISKALRGRQTAQQALANAAGKADKALKEQG